jgi:energy-converting hydrogenase Eha subunit G
LKVFSRLIVKKVESDDRVMEWMTVRPIDTEDLRAAGSFLEIGDVVFGKLLTQVEADHIEFGYVAHVPFVHPSNIVCSKSEDDWCSL